MSDATREPRPPRAAQRAFEPVAKALAGRRWFPLWAVMHHRGRRSGTAYATPVAVVPTTDRGAADAGGDRPAPRLSRGIPVGWGAWE